MKITPIVVILAMMTGQVASAGVLEDAGRLDEPRAMMTEWLNAAGLAALEARREAVAALNGTEAIFDRQQDIREAFVDALGGFPERTPLNAQVVATGEGDGFRYEKIIFESQPGHHVTGVLFLPTTPGPYPGVIVPCGHSSNGKAAETYQRASILLARNGMAAFCYDPIGQGERYYFYKEDDSGPLFGPTLQHTVMGVGAIALGSNLATYRIWDGIRALDYLESREDIDAERLACTGNSGGGTLTAYIMALDERVSVAAASCYLTSFEYLLTTIGPQDAEQNIFGQLAFGMDHSDYIMLRAPKPTLVLCATHDYFAAAGTWQSYRENAWINTQLSSSHTLSIAEANENHGFSKPLRQAMVQWMSRWLLGVDEAIIEPDFEILSDEEMLCTATGRVIDLPGHHSIFDLIAKDADKKAALRSVWKRTTDGVAQRAKVLELIGARDADILPEPSARIVDSETTNGTRKERLVIESAPGIYLPGTLYTHGDDVEAVTLYLSEEGHESLPGKVSALIGALPENHAALALDLRGLGETRSNFTSHNWDEYVGADWVDYYRAYLLGKTYVGMRTDDIMQGVAWLNLTYPDATVSLWAEDLAAVPALHAVALAPEQFEKAELFGLLPSWDQLVRTPRAKQQLMNTVHGALAWYDLPLLREWAGDTLTVHDESLAEF